MICQNGTMQSGIVRSMFTLPAVVTLLAATSAKASSEREVEYGNYVCVSDRAVGFQPSENASQEIYSGRIQLDPTKQKFFIRISPVTVEANPDKAAQIDVHSPSFCNDLFGSTPDGLWLKSGFDIDMYNILCLSHSILEITTSGTPTKYYSSNKNIFHGLFADVFWIGDDWNFFWATRYRPFAYMLEGRCDLVK